jgi:hypothetical protein
MRRQSASALLLVCAVTWGLAVWSTRPASARQEEWHGVLDEHPSIQYATRPATDRVAALNQKLADGSRSLRRTDRTGYLESVLDALGVPQESQLLVFSKTGVQRAYTSPRTPRALYFNDSVVVGYIPGAPAIELAAHDPQQGVVFYTLDQNSARPSFSRATVCLTCHVSATTLDVPGLIARSNAVGDDGNVMPQEGSNDVTHQTPHPDRWGGWFVTSEAPAPYAQRAHAGNITFSRGGVTSNQVFVEWMTSQPEARGYLSPSSDIAALLVFDHQTRAVNLLTRLNWEARIAGTSAGTLAPSLRPRAVELADYLLFGAEVAPTVPLMARPGFAEHLAAHVPQDRLGRSCAQLDLDRRLMRYPCSFMVYSAAFDALPSVVKQAVYQRMIDVLSADVTPRDFRTVSAEDRRAVLEILRDTKSDFPGPDGSDRLR